MSSVSVKSARKMLNSKINLVDYFNEYVVPKKSGLSYISKSHTGSICPFHTEKDPSFRYYADSNRFKCFGCGVSGDIVGLHKMTEAQFNRRRITEEEAIKELIRLYNLNIDISEYEKRDIFKECRGKLSPNTENKGMSMTKLFERHQRILNSKELSIDEKVQAYSELDNMAVAYLEQKVRGN